MKLKIKTTGEIIDLDFTDDLVKYNAKWVSVESLKANGIDIEATIDGGNNPEKLVDGIFIPYEWLKGE
jgi:hypothetical protein